MIPNVLETLVNSFSAFDEVKSVILIVYYIGETRRQSFRIARTSFEGGDRSL
jgi:hypothetical protein